MVDGAGFGCLLRLGVFHVLADLLQNTVLTMPRGGAVDPHLNVGKGNINNNLPFLLAPVPLNLKEILASGILLAAHASGKDRLGHPLIFCR